MRRPAGPSPFHGHLAPVLVGSILAVGALSGCLFGGGPDGSEAPEDGAGERPDDGSGAPDPRTRIPDDAVSGAQKLEELLLDEGGAVGYVYNERTREPLVGASVVAHCLLDGSGLPLAPQLAMSDGTGRFVFDAGVPLSQCDQVAYDAVLIGHEQEEVVASPGLAQGEQYLVFIGMRTVAQSLA